MSPAHCSTAIHAAAAGRDTANLDLAIEATASPRYFAWGDHKVGSRVALAHHQHGRRRWGRCTDRRKAPGIDAPLDGVMEGAMDGAGEHGWG